MLLIFHQSQIIDTDLVKANILKGVNTQNTKIGEQKNNTQSSEVVIFSLVGEKGNTGINCLI